MRVAARLAGAVAVACLGLSSCAKPAAAPRPTRTTAAVAPGPISPALAQAEAIENGIDVADEIRTNCDLPGDPDDAPHFDFDSARLSPRSAVILDAVGACLTSGGLAMRRVRVVGHTDARGSRRYNDELGLARAWAAKMELEKVGVPPGNVEVVSRGEADARGDHEAGHARDRRVDIELAP